MHQYFDSDGSGTSATCVSSTIGSERVKAATQWLKDNKKLAILGEFAGGANLVCESAVIDLLKYMGQNTEVWLGGLWWGGGPWWKNISMAWNRLLGVLIRRFCRWCCL
jgi:endoglucanase